MFALWYVCTAVKCSHHHAHIWQMLLGHQCFVHNLVHKLQGSTTIRVLFLCFYWLTKFCLTILLATLLMKEHSLLNLFAFQILSFISLCVAMKCSIQNRLPSIFAGYQLCHYFCYIQTIALHICLGTITDYSQYIETTRTTQMTVVSILFY